MTSEDIATAAGPTVRPSPAEVLRAAAGARAGIGVDLVAVARVREQLARHGERWCRDMLTAPELTGLGRRAEDPEAVAGRVAAKEAVIKVLAPDDVVPWRDIEVFNEPGGAPVVRLTGRAAEWAARRHLRRLEVSITHDAGWAAAVAVGIGADETVVRSRRRSHGATASVDT